jgi:hypothetical protein
VTQNRGTQAGTIFAAGLTLCWLAATPAAADDAINLAIPVDDPQLGFSPLDIEPDPSAAGWLAAQHFHIAKKSGFGYTRRLKLGERSMSLSIRGPVMQRQKALGLRFRVRF